MNERGDFGAVALAAAGRDLTAPLVLLRQLSFQLESLPEIQSTIKNDGRVNSEVVPNDGRAGGSSDDTSVSKTLAQMRLAIGRTFDIAEQLKWALGDVDAISPEPIQLAGLCYELNQELKPLQRELKCTVDLELPRRQSVVASGSYGVLKTILTGFLTDALKYEQTHRDVNNKKCERVVRMRVATSKNGQALISVTDYGTGSVNLARTLVAAAKADNVAPATERPLIGSLNLLVADKMLRAMSGGLKVHNHRGGGVTVDTYLPLSKQLTLLEV